MKILHILRDLDAKSGGPSRSVPALADHLAALGHEVQIATVRAAAENGVKRGKTAHIPWPSAASSQAELRHVHGLWTPELSQISRCGRPTIWSPRGMLEPWARRHKRVKKFIGWWLYQRWSLRKAPCLHATANSELASLRAAGLRNPVVVIPNGVVIPEDLPALPPLSKRTRTILFLSRIQKKKGLLNLVKAWTHCRRDGWQICIVGPDEDGHREEVKAAASQAGFSADFRFDPPVEDESKWPLLQNAELFVLPTFSENFGIAVAEALAAGTPVITTKGAPWEILEIENCGWWIDIGVEPLVRALREAMDLTDAQRAAMGQRGRDMVQREFSWPEIAARMIAVYEWILEGGTPPPIVQLS